MLFNKGVLHISYESLASPNGVSSHVSGLVNYDSDSKAITIRNKQNLILNKSEFSLKAKTKFNEIFYCKISLILQSIKLVKNSSIVHFHISNFSGLIYLLISILYSKKVVSTFHTIPKFKTNLVVNLESFRVVIVYNIQVIFSNEIIIFTSFQKDEIGKYILFRNKYERIVKVIPGFVKQNEFNVRNINHSGVLNIIYIGRLEKEKGFHDLINIIKLLDKNLFKIKIIGDGILKNIIPKKQSNIEYLGIVPNSMVLKHMHSSDVLLCTSYNEVFPVTLLEAMSLGLAIVTTQLPSLEALVLPNRNALFFKFGDIVSAAQQLQELSRNKDELDYLSANNLEDIKKFYIENVFPLYSKIYVGEITK